MWSHDVHYWLSNDLLPQETQLGVVRWWPRKTVGALQGGHDGHFHWTADALAHVPDVLIAGGQAEEAAEVEGFSPPVAVLAGELVFVLSKATAEV
jgi:hypothetical protein